MPIYVFACTNVQVYIYTYICGVYGPVHVRVIVYQPVCRYVRAHYHSYPHIYIYIYIRAFMRLRVYVCTRMRACTRLCMEDSDL